jgi:DNA-directed RNA polymerase subunit RPC12/RpoP
MKFDMKCIQCGTDNKLSDRTGNQGRCKNCNHPFVFEPASMGTVKLTDPFFAKVIADISATNTLYFTPKQVFYLLDKRLKKRRIENSLFIYLFLSFIAAGFSIFFSVVLLQVINNFFIILAVTLVNIIFIPIFYRNSQSIDLNYKQRRYNANKLKIIGGLLLGIGILISLGSNSFPLFVVSVFLGMLSIYLGTRPIKPQAELSQSFLFTKNQFQQWLNRWRQVNGQIPKILPSPREESTQTLVSPEVSAYSFDRLVVCDSAAIAQLLIANNFHFENNCAVLSITGYPQSIFRTVMDMLRRNPELKVYALHDATPRGVSLLHRLRSSSSWFGNSNVTIIDLGLLPRQLFSTRNVFVQSSDESAQAAKQLPAAVRDQLSTEELEWLESGKFVELESFTPQKLMQVVTQGIAGSRNLDLESEDSSLILVGDTGSVYAWDSFG